MHALICGVTQSGKTTLAHRMAAAFAKKRVPVIVFDPVGTETEAGTWPESADVYSEEADFIDRMNDDRTSHCVVFVDEAAEIFGHTKRDHFWMLTRGRHFGLTMILIAQRPKMIHPSVRSQCGRAYVFRLASDDLDEVGRDFGHTLREESLDKGDYLVLDSGSAKYTRANVFVKTGYAYTVSPSSH